ncbi:cysteine-rich CWC family protein [Thermoplasmatales archaeon AK]|nr:cysteine-rich CWC family protein [Thermoplasmatales archaeon AK]
MRKMRCEICFDEFLCLAPFPCWCSTVHISDEKRTSLKSLAEDCVCPSCLRG